MIDFSADSEMEEISGKEEPTQSNSESGTPILDNFSRDLTAIAAKGGLDPVIGRDDEVKRIVQILARRKKNNPVLIGEPGAGKTSVVEMLATMIHKGECPRKLMNKRIVLLELSSLVAGTKYRGQFEERMKAIIDELRENKDVIIFIDEIHTVVGTGNSSGNLDAANIFKPPLARGEVQCIGATTMDEFREKIEKDGALERRFQKVTIDPPSVKDTIEILDNIKHVYEEHHNVTYDKYCVELCVKLADRYISDRAFPDKAIDIMDEVGSMVQIDVKTPKSLEKLRNEISILKNEKIDVVKSQDYEKAADLRDKERKLTTKLKSLTQNWEEKQSLHKVPVTEENIMTVVSKITKIPLSRMNQNEKKNLLNLDKQLKKSVIGQDKAINTIVKSVRRNSVGIKELDKPIGSFICLGPTGVGKTHLAKKLAELMFGSEESMIRVDMSEYQEKHSVSRLIGSPPGYVGYNEGGQFTEKVRQNPYSLILFDEIEKGHREIFNILLQILDDGYVTDASGRKINFKNTLIMMTSNIGVKNSQDFSNSLGFTTKASQQTDKERVRTIISKSLKNTFNPEFLNRLDDIIIFETLDKGSIKKIVKIELSHLTSRLVEKGYSIKFGPSVVDHICGIGYDEKFGARPLKRSIQSEVEDFIAAEILKSGIGENQQYTMSYNKTTEKFKLVEKQ
ncbi:ATP-dependent Clp protease ATP-binding subunit [bacterium]|jgi:ATP-dependent Clp protease ATP-binding subunit ClpC|nr:ATP-dependent Clp protease ATP-binding subunit [bacterium]|tara:strand:- start:1388 stop:3424 length:2037 start_codon:yes stop_codon:yes gene_type:complete